MQRWIRPVSASRNSWIRVESKWLQHKVIGFTVSGGYKMALLEDGRWVLFSPYLIWSDYGLFGWKLNYRNYVKHVIHGRHSLGSDDTVKTYLALTTASLGRKKKSKLYYIDTSTGMGIKVSEMLTYTFFSENAFLLSSLPWAPEAVTILLPYTAVIGPTPNQYRFSWEFRTGIQQSLQCPQIPWTKDMDNWVGTDILGHGTWRRRHKGPCEGTVAEGRGRAQGQGTGAWACRIGKRRKEKKQLPCLLMVFQSLLRADHS